MLFLLDQLRRCGELPSAKSAAQTLLRIAWPSMLEMVLVTLVGMIDMMMVGGLGSYAISAVGLTTQPKLIFLTLFFAINVGCTAIIARRKGEGDRDGAGRCLRQTLMLSAGFSLLLTGVAIFFADGAGRCLRQTLMLSAGFSLLLTGVAIFFAPQMMAAAGANEDTLGPSSTYFRIVMASLFFNAISLNISAAQRGCGQTHPGRNEDQPYSKRSQHCTQLFAHRRPSRLSSNGGGGRSTRHLYRHSRRLYHCGTFALAPGWVSHPLRPYPLAVRPKNASRPLEPIKQRSARTGRHAYRLFSLCGNGCKAWY